MKSQGIVIIAGGSRYYGNCALNLCVSIRYADKHTPITIFHDSQAIDAKHMETFGRMSNISFEELNPELYLSGSSANFYRVKTRLYELTPYDQTLYLDADTLWLGCHSAAKFFEEFSEVDFSMINEGFVDLSTGKANTTGFYTFWRDTEGLKSDYGKKLGDRLYQLRSEMILFKKSPAVARFFRKAQSIYDNPKSAIERVAVDKVPDEYAFNIASSITGLYPHKDHWNPMFWEFKERACRRFPVSDTVIINSFYAYSVGGNRLSESQRKFYNEKVKAYYANHRFPSSPWKIVNKKDVIKERAKL